MALSIFCNNWPVNGLDQLLLLWGSHGIIWLLDLFIEQLPNLNGLLTEADSNCLKVFSFPHRKHATLEMLQ